MNYCTGMKKLFLLTAFVFMFLTTQAGTFASDYQYKVLDPKYNPSANELVEGNIPPVEEVELPDEHKGFDFLTFLAIIAAVSFPIFIISLAVKAFKEVTEDVPGRQKVDDKTNVSSSSNQVIGNIKISESEKGKELAKSEEKSVRKESFTDSSVNIQKSKTKSTKMSQKTRQMIENNRNVAATNVSYSTTPINKKNPMLLNTSRLDRNKGLCLVEYNKKYSLIGYINDEIFLLNQFKDINSKEIRSRLTETVEDKDRYIVRLGNYKAVVEVSESDMNLLLEL